MSYDLFFKTRGAPLDRAKVTEYFASRPNYRCDPPAFVYVNPETGVYFHFAFEDEAEGEEALPDGLPIATAEVDYFLVARDELAPRRLLMRRKDQVMLPWAEALPWIVKYRASDESLLVMKYDRQPEDLKQFIRALPAVEPVLEPVRPDQMLDSELVEKYRRRPQ